MALTELQQVQTIQAGACLLMVGDIFTNNINDSTTTQINQSASPSGYNTTATALVVDDASLIAPNVWETSVGSAANPAVLDFIVNIRTGEVMACYSRTDSTETINVIRGLGIYWTKFRSSLTQYNQAINDDDYLQLLGTGSLPTRDNAIVTVDDITIDVTYDVFQTMDNQKGYENAYLSAPANATFTVSLPRNTLPNTMRTLGIQGLTDGNTPASYFVEPGKQSAGTQLPKKFVILIPNEEYFNNAGITIGATDYLDLSKCYLIPKAQFDLNQSRTFSNSAQANLEATFYASYDDVWQKCIHFGGPNDLMRAAEQI